MKDGPGVVTVNYGAESIGLGNIIAFNMPLMSESCIDKNLTIPAPGFDETKTMNFIPSMAGGHTMLVSYDMDANYFPSAYSVMLGQMISEKYSKGEL